MFQVAVGPMNQDFTMSSHVLPNHWPEETSSEISSSTSHSMCTARFGETQMSIEDQLKQAPRPLLATFAAAAGVEVESITASSNDSSVPTTRTQDRQHNLPFSNNMERIPLPENGANLYIGGTGKSAADMEKMQNELEAALKGAGHWSRGCRQHLVGCCKPCHYIRSRSGCDNGASCTFCHFPHTGTNRRSLGMSARLYCKSFGDAILSSFAPDSDSLEEVIRISASGSSYLGAFLTEKAGLSQDGNSPQAVGLVKSSSASEASVIMPDCNKRQRALLAAATALNPQATGIRANKDPERAKPKRNVVSL